MPGKHRRIAGLSQVRHTAYFFLIHILYFPSHITLVTPLNHVKILANPIDVACKA